MQKLNIDEKDLIINLIESRIYGLKESYEYKKGSSSNEYKIVIKDYEKLLKKLKAKK
jgi:hypothetical protein